MPNAYKLWKRLEDEENIKLYTKCGIMNISDTERAPVFTGILAKNNIDYSVYDGSEVSDKYPVNIWLVKKLSPVHSKG